MKTSDLLFEYDVDYDLPESFIAQTPAGPRGKRRGIEIPASVHGKPFGLI